MATFSQPTIESGSDMVQDFLCSTCEEKKLEESADYYCESCVKFFCRKCIDLHSQLFTQHSHHGRGDMKKWPVAKKMEDFLLKCDVHKEENNEMFCEDHSQLCCNKCAILNHRTCKTVILLSDLVKNTRTDLKQVSVTIQTTLAKLKELQENQEDSIQTLLSSYDEQLHKIQENRKKIIAALNKLEQKAMQELKDTLTKLQAPLDRDIDKCSTLQDELKQLGEAIHDIGDKNKQELSLIASIKCKEKIQQFEKYQKENFVEIKSVISFQPNNKIVEYLSKLSGLGMTLTVIQNPNKVIRMDGKSEYDVRTEGEFKCSIGDIYHSQ
ncbi:E3 ubiquitin-protein ligase TRIM33-like [Dreissena polymorpha]|uniref:E3 ubiquitin-protein ligase TRIM33-like n=1 Tax=Dreissena polymorpha TaxID=45954 RepID=UPI00226548DC|nr:E3 ubiquitin-protein ligase TRIM33-like [Dreissena polymorpha]